MNTETNEASKQAKGEKIQVNQNLLKILICLSRLFPMQMCVCIKIQIYTHSYIYTKSELYDTYCFVACFYN